MRTGPWSLRARPRRIFLLWKPRPPIRWTFSNAAFVGSTAIFPSVPISRFVPRTGDNHVSMPSANIYFCAGKRLLIAEIVRSSGWFEPNMEPAAYPSGITDRGLRQFTQLQFQILQIGGPSLPIHIQHYKAVGATGQNGPIASRELPLPLKNLFAVACCSILESSDVRSFIPSHRKNPLAAMSQPMGDDKCVCCAKPVRKLSNVYADGQKFSLCFSIELFRSIVRYRHGAYSHLPRRRAASFSSSRIA